MKYIVFLLLICTAASAVSEFNMRNGIKVIYEYDNSSDIIAVSYFVRSGSRYEHKKYAGISYLTNNMLLKGTQTKNAQEVSQIIDELGAVITNDEDKDYCNLGLKVFSKNFSDALDLFAEIIQYPAFDTAEFDSVKKLTLKKQKLLEDDMWEYTENIFETLAYSAHPYRNPVMGTEYTIPYITCSMVKNWHSRLYIPNNSVISVVGNISEKELKAELSRCFTGWKSGKLPIQVLRMLAAGDIVENKPTSERTKFIPKDKEQVQIFIGFQAPSVRSDDFAALKIVDAVMGEGMSSRLFVNLRDKQSLAYSVSSWYPTRADLSFFTIYIGCAPDKHKTAVTEIVKEVESLLKDGITETELQKAKNKISGNHALSHEHFSKRAWYYGWYEIIGAGWNFDRDYIDQINKVTAAHVLDAARKYFDLKYYCFAACGKK